MQQIKIFKGLESQLETIENGINEWLKESGAKVVQIFGNIAPQGASQGNQAAATISSSKFVASDVLIVVLYELPDQG